MKLHSITIAGFRGFASKQQFDLSADAIIVVGVNGLGKTSLLDAILWGLCGDLARVGADDRLVSLYSTSGQAQVSLHMKDREGLDVIVRRTTDGETQQVHVIDGGKEYSSALASAHLCQRLWPDAASAGDGNKVLCSALTRSVYLQQDRVRDFLEATTDQERFAVISELVGTGRLTELQLQLDKQRTSWTKITNQIKKDGEALELRVENLARQYERLQKLIADEPASPSMPWADWWSQAISLGIASREVPTIDSVDAASSLDSAIRDLTGLQDATQRRKALAVSLLELLEKEPPVPATSLSELQDVVAKASANAIAIRTQLEKAKDEAIALRQAQIAAQESQEQLKALAQLALQLLASTCPVCTQQINIEQVRERLVSLATPVSQEPLPPAASAQSVLTLSEKEKEAANQENAAKQALRQAQERQAEVKTWSDVRDRHVIDLRIQITPGMDLKKAATAIMTECDQRLNQLQQHRRSGETLSLHIGRELARARSTTAKSDLDAANKELLMHRAVVAAREATHAQASLLLDELREASAKVSMDKLTEIEPFLQRIYARIDPHPAFRVVKFASRLVRGRGRLDTELHDRHDRLSSNSPAAVLSSSQLNALAVSVFLSFNLSLPRLPLDVAILDDPIQSLDDINLLGMVDLLRRTKDKRQLIVSTHDERFGRLLERKLRPASDSQRTSVISLEGWTRSGPSVQQFDVPAEAISLRMIKAG